MNYLKKGGIFRLTLAWRLPLAIAALVIILQVLHLQPILQYQRELIIHGEWWRLLTGNLVHLGWVHLVRDLGGLFLVWLYFSDYQNEGDWWFLCVLASLGVSVGLLSFNAQIHWYVGLSGMEYGLFGAGAVLEWQRKRWLSGLMLFGVWSIVLYGVLVGPLPGESTGLGGEVIPQAHLYGLICGIVFVMARWRCLRYRTSSL